MVCSADGSKAVVPVLVLLFVALWFVLRGDLFYVLHYVILFCVFSPFSTAITSLGEVRANLSAFRTFARFALVCYPLPLGVWEGLRIVILALPVLFSYLFLTRFTNPYLLMQLQTVQQYKQKENIKQIGQPLEKMTTMGASLHENRK